MISSRLFARLVAAPLDARRDESRSKAVSKESYMGKTYDIPRAYLAGVEACGGRASGRRVVIREFS